MPRPKEKSPGKVLYRKGKLKLMERWTELKDGAGNAKDKIETDFDLDFTVEECRFDPCKERIRSLFDQVLAAFMKEKSVSKCSRPIPALCGDGRQVDLFKLFWVVRKIGGYDNVSRNNLWGFVSEECGLGFGVIPSVKLIYIKYLKELDQWLHQVFSERTLEDRKNGVVQKLDILSQELETRFRVVMSNGQNEQQKNNKYVDRIKERNNINLDTSETEFHFLPIRGIRGQVEDKKKLFVDKDEKTCLDKDNDFRLSTKKIAEKITCEICGNENKKDKDDNEKFHIGNDFAASAKRVVKKAVNDVNGFSKGHIDADGGKSRVNNSDRIIASAKKVFEKVVDRVHNNGERAAADEDSYPVQDNAGVPISAKRVVKKVISKAYDLPKSIVDVEQRFNTLKSIDVMVPDRSAVIGNVRDARKRKRKFESFAEMLNWLKHVAKQPDNPAIGLIPECSKWRDHEKDYFWVQALLIREALMIRRCANANAHNHLLKNQHKKSRMHPSMYEEDILNHQSTERLRCSERIPSLAKPNLCPCCNLEAASPSRIISPQKAAMGNSLKALVEPVVTNDKEPATELNDDKSTDFTAGKRVSVGPCFQAEIPEWTGKCLESDSKWLGTRMWPPENVDKKSLVGLDPIGKGRRDSCSCAFQDSVECVRFHIAEKRFKLKRELGLLFFRWRFDRMGEEVSLSWTKEEEERFKDMMRSYAAFPNKFWINAYRFLPSKTKENLVSYYFNVFLVRRRSYQNRVTPKELDSDDDEKECGSIGDSFGYKALYIPGSRLLTCTQNMVSTELV